MECHVISQWFPEMPRRVKRIEGCYGQKGTNKEKGGRESILEF